MKVYISVLNTFFKTKRGIVDDRIKMYFLVRYYDVLSIIFTAQ